MGNHHSRYAKSSQDAVDQYRSRIINQLDIQRLPERKRIELQDELDRFMGLSEKEQEVCAALKLGYRGSSPTRTVTSSRSRTSSRSVSSARPMTSVGKIPVLRVTSADGESIY